MVDNGYDIEDYLQVDPIFGSLDDFKKLIDTFKAKNIKVVIDSAFPGLKTDKQQLSIFLKKLSNETSPFFRKISNG